ncbi:MAG TPA: DUF4365 domain-containing protein [Nostocaceae cyanobacterium]|nr:DUF4365 domain-containing protein [Nostocaceae cyanobacterium]
MMKKEEPWYFSFRSEAIASLYLTRRDDVTICKQEKGQDINLIVTIAKDKSSISRVFGVIVKANVSSENLVQKSDEEIFKININLTDFQTLLKLKLPICLFFFNVDNDEGFYKWVVEPVTENTKYSTLQLNEENRFKILTDAEINNIVDLVNVWYDKRKHQKSKFYHDYLISSLQDFDHRAVDLEAILQIEALRKPKLLNSALKDFIDVLSQENDLTETAKQKYGELNQILLETCGNEIYTLIEFLDAVRL